MMAQPKEQRTPATQIGDSDNELSSSLISPTRCVDAQTYYRIYVKRMNGQSAIGRSLYYGSPPFFGSELDVPLTGGDIVKVRISSHYIPKQGRIAVTADVLADEI